MPWHTVPLWRTTVAFIARILYHGECMVLHSLIHSLWVGAHALNASISRNCLKRTFVRDTYTLGFLALYNIFVIHRTIWPFNCNCRGSRGYTVQSSLKPMGYLHRTRLRRPCRLPPRRGALRHPAGPETSGYRTFAGVRPSAPSGSCTSPRKPRGRRQGRRI